VCLISWPEASSFWIHDRRRMVIFLKIKFVFVINNMLFWFLFSCGPQFFLAKNAMDWERGNDVGGFQYGIYKSTILQVIAKKKLILVWAKHLGDTTTKRYSGVLFSLEMDEK
jgi:hypothetical protein